MIPALGLFEAGLLRRKNTVSIFMQIFFGLAILSVMWFTVGFSLSFGPEYRNGSYRKHGLDIPEKCPI
ncbi:MAG: hypothetical protein ACYC6W_05530 [Nitrosotalea sp.]